MTRQMRSIRNKACRRVEWRLQNFSRRLYDTPRGQAVASLGTKPLQLEHVFSDAMVNSSSLDSTEENSRSHATRVSEFEKFIDLGVLRD